MPDKVPINRRVEDAHVIERAMELAEVIASGPPVALAFGKPFVYRGTGKSINAQMALQNVGTFLKKAYTPNDLKEAISAFGKRHRPSFTNR